MGRENKGLKEGILMNQFARFFFFFCFQCCFGPSMNNGGWLV
jgi:hypothetical protein